MVDPCSGPGRVRHRGRAVDVLWLEQQSHDSSPSSDIGQSLGQDVHVHAPDHDDDRDLSREERRHLELDRRTVPRRGLGDHVRQSHHEPGPPSRRTDPPNSPATIARARRDAGIGAARTGISPAPDRRTAVRDDHLRGRRSEGQIHRATSHCRCGRVGDRDVPDLDHRSGRHVQRHRARQRRHDRPRRVRRRGTDRPYLGVRRITRSRRLAMSVARHDEDFRTCSSQGSADRLDASGESPT